MEFIGLEYFDISRSEKPFVVDGVTIGLPFNLQELVDRYGKYWIPDSLGIYHLFYHDQLVYIGMSKNLRNRLLGHLRDNDMVFNNVLWFCSSVIDNGNPSIKRILDIEYKMIKKFKPALNCTHANCR